MKTKTAQFLCVSLALASASCAILWRPVQGLTERGARELRENCRTGGEQEETVVSKFLDPVVVDRLEPIYSTVRTGRGNREAHLIGARLFVHPLEGVTSELLERALRCHNARKIAQQTADTTPPDPFWCPTCWIEIGVSSAGNGLEIQLKNEELVTAKRILSRAETFIGRAPSEITK
jgi:hypothetical protein